MELEESDWLVIPHEYNSKWIIPSALYKLAGPSHVATFTIRRNRCHVVDGTFPLSRMPDRWQIPITTSRILPKRHPMRQSTCGNSPYGLQCNPGPVQPQDNSTLGTASRKAKVTGARQLGTFELRSFRRIRTRQTGRNLPLRFCGEE